MTVLFAFGICMATAATTATVISCGLWRLCRTFAHTAILTPRCE